MNKTKEMQKLSKRRKKMGEYLVDAKIIDDNTLKEALKIQKTKNMKLGQILIDMGVTDEKEIARVLSEQLQIPLLDFSNITIPKEIVNLVPSELAENHLVIPVKRSGKRLLVAMVNPLDFYALDDLRFATQMDVDIAIAPQSEILESIDRYYQKIDLEKAFGPGSEIGDQIELIQGPRDEEDGDEPQFGNDGLCPVPERGRPAPRRPARGPSRGQS